MNLSDKEVSAIVKEVVAKLQLEKPESTMGIFDDMNEAIAAAKAAQAIVKRMPLDAREKVISNIRKATIENAEILATMGVEETGMGNVGHKILKHRLTAEMTPGRHQDDRVVGRQRSYPYRNGTFRSYRRDYAVY